MRLRVLIVDDEEVARRGLRRLLAAESDVDVVGECGDGEEALQAIATLAPDLVLLDVQMPELGGFELVEAIGAARMPATIFVTAFDAYALRAFDANAIDYVLKPVDGARLARALERVRARRGALDARAATRIDAALRELSRSAPPRWPTRLAVRGDGRVRLVALRDVDRIEAAGNYVELHLGTQTLLMRETLTALAARLDPARFVRVSRSSIVAIDRIRELQPMFNGDFVVILHDATQVAGSRRYRAALDAVAG